MFDIDSLNLGEIAKVEELSGQSIGQLGEQDCPQGLFLAALVFVTQRRDQPTYTWNEACGVTIPQANALLGLDAPAEPEAEEVSEPDPTDLPDLPPRQSRH